MLSHDPEETAFNIIPINGGDIVGFATTPHNHLSLNGVVHCEVDGPTYVMNSEGKTVAQFNTKHPNSSNPVIKVEDITHAVKNSGIDFANKTIRGNIAARIVSRSEVPQGVKIAAREYEKDENLTKVFRLETMVHDWVLFHDHRRDSGWMFAILTAPIGSDTIFGNELT